MSAPVPEMLLLPGPVAFSSRINVPLLTMFPVTPPLVAPLPIDTLAPLLIVVAPVKVLTPRSVSVPVPDSVRPPAPEMTPANEVEALSPPVMSVAEPRVMALDALPLAIEPTVLLKLVRARVPLLLRVTALRPLPKALVEPAVRVPTLTTVEPE